jgi:hypothetical protein
VERARQSALATDHADRASRRAWVVSPRREAPNPLADKGACSLECSRVGMLTRERLQGPKRHLSPDGGKRVGGVSGRPTREGGRSNPFDPSQSRRWKAPGLWEAGGLRGSSDERRPRSVDRCAQRFLLGVRIHRRQRVLFGRREGERRRSTPKNAWATDARASQRTRTR